ncbi:G-type lectin S-receptor-like serine threonine-kinase At4g27290 [Olea europaea subsp. europaea]|uniref:G-type lectin S-receptor-like serine threonine-kinase At4g27290 n=1 Tax=Olea europaea subsp. europaea TaxID=158383 RepID=A0A8S0SJT5_OLEEU|nr:G-type lectin S-receptor-like serine threonine-kinase At4g27290 [Olea europaea subsp. europaea]
MEKSIKDISLLLLLTSILSILEISPAIDTISTTQSLKDGDTMVSSGGTFELGFFSPGDSKNRYVGIWYKKVPSITAVWVLNREIPLNSRSGILKFNELGHLVLVNDTNNLLWSSNTSRIAGTPILQLLDSGNLVLREANDDNPENFLWESFDYLSDTYLPGMNFGWNAATGVQNYLSSWTSNEDPAPGDLTFYLDPTGYPQVFIKRGTDDRPRMTTVVALLSNEGKLPKANQPGFFTEGDVFVDEGTTSTNEASSTNEITITQLEAR